MMKIVNKLCSLKSLVTLSLGIFLLTGLAPLEQDEVAPYEYGNYPREDTLKELKQHKKFYQERVERSPDSGLDLAALANIYVAESNLTGDLAKMDKAEETAKKSLLALPYYNEAPKVTLAQVAESRHHFQEAIDQALKVYQDDYRNKGALTTLVTSYMGFGQPLEAQKYADKLVEVAPGPETHTLRALTFLAQGKDVEGLSDFDKALSAEGPGQRLQSAWIRTLIGRHYYRMGDLPKAEAYTNSALSVLDDYHVALAQKADVEALKGNLDESQKLYKRAYGERQEPPYLLAHAKLLEKIKRPEKADELRKTAEESVRLEIETTPYGHYNELAQILIDRGDPAQREEAIQASLKDVEQRRTSESYYLLSQAYFNAGKFEEAESAIQQAISSGEKNCEYQAMLRQIEAQQGGNSENQVNCPQFYF